MEKLENIFVNHHLKKSSKWHHYFDIYDRHLSKFRDKQITLLEIGVAEGGSLQIWKKYFDEKSKIFGIDIREDCKYEESQIEIFIGDQTDYNFLTKVIDRIGIPDIIIDDGSHVQSHILKTFDFLYPILNENDGVYVIEDCHTAYWPRFEGGVNSHLNVVEIFSKRVHDVNSKWYNEPKTPKLKTLDSIHFYDSMIVFEKRKNIYHRYMVDTSIDGPKIMEKV